MTKEDYIFGICIEWPILADISADISADIDFFFFGFFCFFINLYFCVGYIGKISIYRRYITDIDRYFPIFRISDFNL